MTKRITQLLMSGILAFTLLAGGFLSQPVKAGVGDTITQTFPDTNLAQAVADTVAGGNVNATLTQDMVDSVLYLSASDRGIQNITCIDTLSNSKYLHLENNQLTSLPDTMVRLGNLQYLYLENNQLTSLPEDLGDLVNFTVLVFMEQPANKPTYRLW